MDARGVRVPELNPGGVEREFETDSAKRDLSYEKTNRQRNGDAERIPANHIEQAASAAGESAHHLMSISRKRRRAQPPPQRSSSRSTPFDA